ncbi:MAG: hypothetical protein VKO26_01680 [Cyanobacteriota bacterium]|nr:hypothetical protein [Cyanobacteriota bacterium]
MTLVPGQPAEIWSKKSRSRGVDLFGWIHGGGSVAARSSARSALPFGHRVWSFHPGCAFGFQALPRLGFSDLAPHWFRPCSALVFGLCSASVQALLSIGFQTLLRIDFSGVSGLGFQTLLRISFLDLLHNSFFRSC